VHRDEGVKDKAQFKKNMLSVSKVAVDALMYEHLLADLRPEHWKESTQVAQSKPQFINSYCRLCLRPVRSKRSRRCEKTCIDCSAINDASTPERCMTAEWHELTCAKGGA